MSRKIRKAAVIGSGIMGGGIAALLAAAGVKVLLLDIVPFDLTDEEKNDPAARNRMVDNGMKATLAAKPSLFMTKKDAALIETGNLTDDFDKLADCDWICEVVVENLKIKQELFARIDKVRKADAIISSNTSGIPLAKISDGLSAGFKEHFLGTHFFNPVRYMHLLELIPGAETKQEVLDFIANFGEVYLGKGIVWAKDTPNFIGNRIGIQGIGRVLQAVVEDDITMAEADALLGPAMGRPRTAIFGTADMVGLDTMVHVADNSYELCPEDEMRDTVVVPDFVKKMLADNKLGNKTKEGFYKKGKDANGKRFKKQLDPATGEYIDIEKPSFPCLDAAKKAATPAEKMQAIVYGDDKGAKFVWKCTANAMTYCGNRIPEIADSLVEIDNAMKWGYGWDVGPFEAWDAIGVRKSVEKMEAEGLPVSAKVKAMLDAGVESFYRVEKGVPQFYDFDKTAYVDVPLSASALSLAAAKADGKVALSCPSASLVDIGDGVYCLEFTTKMNALNGEIIDFMGGALDYVDEHGVGLVIGNQAGGMPGAFSAGADLAFVLKKAEDKAYDELDAFLEKGQMGMLRGLYSSFPVVAAPYGMTLGGGCEVCLSADKIVAHSELYMGLVEIGVGLLPAGGGCLNLWKKYITSLPAGTDKDTDLAKLFIPTFMKIAMAAVSMSAAGAVANGHLSPTKDRIVMNRDLLIGEAKKEVLRMVEDGYAPPMKKKVRVIGREGYGMVNAEIFNMLNGGFLSEHDAMLAKRIAYVIAGGDVKSGTEVSEEAILKLEREAFIDFLKEEKSVARIAHMLKTGKPLRN
ncbi:3-hydroxyacyl-CoA dehydrogenase/enoyl-CoA hydratase family protein [Desulfoluna spongiiphila]|uniref:3-hydroxyacyl-CoA dehydrogenase n=1 Tax=Desulfoluna spongiiphila TaxID=419481 RepID=A0A1G5I1R2_9BACT|nr:3-hydroxyacyl-CoA dehydrogenase/enoyl-CoA hydratase family protein [Desulfoluna spongiiphila]SCY69957.1 3-hydroxyacyl-CoA dehydrogenase [Desulfoluna spongiiphila]VVS92642.1 enoyl-coa hydratase/isomerase [Desulfoluna spongiiphila]